MPYQRQSNSRRPKIELAPRQRLRLGIVLAFGVAVVVGLAIFVVFPELQRYELARQAIREQGLQEIRAQISLLPPYPGSQERGRTENTDPGAGPFISIEYDHAGRCVDVHSYYAQIASQTLWRPIQKPHEGSEIISTYQKNLHGFELILTVDCFADASNFMLEMDASQQ